MPKPNHPSIIKPSSQALENKELDCDAPDPLVAVSLSGPSGRKKQKTKTRTVPGTIKKQGAIARSSTGIQSGIRPPAKDMKQLSQLVKDGPWSSTSQDGLKDHVKSLVATAIAPLMERITAL
ncbi:hypothetical protein NDU88_002958 [Pleurodeles waltl]|uniref:Uncharacterized protein n=1 Tax=Pleurodeles waltl TaxID=8319 RepID=A0AAV7KV69_PLEWA|nr:hypothetical protein NDU88_002958 [Pleurodeles waltl]